jgi:hypothetical protein
MDTQLLKRYNEKLRNFAISEGKAQEWSIKK